MSAVETHHIYLVPGFFGFVNFGRLVYFSHVSEFLDLAFHRRGVRAEIHRARVPPTASIRRRAAELAAHIHDTSPEGAPVHIIGHSTGGLDARLLVTPAVNLGNGADVSILAKRIRSIVTISTPHFGTPLASFFASLLGQRLLQVLSMSTVFILREGRLPVSLMVRISAAVARLGFSGGKAEAALEHLHHELVGRLPGTEKDLFSRFFADVSTDQGLVSQLTPEGIDLFNASTVDRSSIRYGSVVARGKKPSVRGHLALRRPYQQATYSLYHALHHKAGGVPRSWDPPMTAAQRAVIDRKLAGLRRSDSDGMVPTRSQVWGTVIDAVQGDHLDLIGHFDDEHQRPPHHDWLTSRSGFDRPCFEALWSEVVDFMLAA